MRFSVAIMKLAIESDMKFTIMDKVMWGGQRATVIGFNEHGFVVVGYYNLIGEYHKAWVSQEDLTLCTA